MLQFVVFGTERELAQTLADNRQRGLHRREAGVFGRAGGRNAERDCRRAHRDEASVRSDLYALGVVIYETLSGRRPFEARTTVELARLHRSAEPPALGSLVDGLDSELERVVHRCLAKDPRQRPASAAEIVQFAGDPAILDWRPSEGAHLPGRPHWRIERQLGEGGFGVVWLARHEKTGERRVLKFCRDVDRLAALQREITLFRLLKEELGDRADINRILDWHLDHEPFFIEAEYAAGGDLGTWADRQGGIAAVPLALRLELVAQVADALAAAHSIGVLHKDVKPTNVLIDDSGGQQQARLADFGVGHALDRERLEAAGYHHPGHDGP